MTRFIAKRVQFRSGERHSVLSRVGGLPVHEATLFLARYRTRSRAANTIHAVCQTLALLYRWLDDAAIDLLERLRAGRFLSHPEIHRLVDFAQYRARGVEESSERSNKGQVINLHRVRMRRSATVATSSVVGTANRATRLRYIAAYLEYLVGYVTLEVTES